MYLFLEVIKLCAQGFDGFGEMQVPRATGQQATAACKGQGIGQGCFSSYLGGTWVATVGQASKSLM